MIPLYALLAVRLARQSAKIDFSCRAEPMSQLVVDLGKAAGLKFTVAPNCANDVILIDAKGVTVEKLLAEIAKVDCGAWKDHQFVAVPAARQAEEREEKKHESARIRNAIKETIQHIKAAPPNSGGDTTAVAGAGQAASEDDQNALRLSLLRIFSGVDPDELVMDPGQRVVFSTHPNSMQRPLGPEAETGLSQIVANYNKRAQAGIAARSDSGGAPTADLQIPPIQGYAKADIVVVGAAGEGFIATVQLYNSAGAQLMEDAAQLLPPAEAAQDTSQPDVPIHLSPASLAFRQMYRSQRSPSSVSVAVPPVLAPYLQRAEQNDPLSLTASDELLALARAKKMPLVAVVPDSAFSDAVAFFSGDAPEITVNGFLAELKAGENMTIADSDGWLEIKPSRPAVERELRCDRSALARFIRNCTHEQFPTLDEFSGFAKEMPELQGNSLLAGYVTTIVSGFGNAGLGTIANWDLYRIFGGFSPDQRATLTSGGRVPLTSLSSSQQSQLFALAFGEYENLNFGSSPGPLQTPFPSASGSQPVQPHDPVGFENEPTELLPNGIQANGWVELSSTPEAFVTPCEQPGLGVEFPRMLGVAQMARREVALNSPRTDRNREAIKFDLYRLGTRTVYLMTLHTSSDSYVAGRLYDFQFDKNSPELSVDQLPQDWKDEVAKRVAQIRAARANNPGQAAPPP